MNRLAFLRKTLFGKVSLSVLGVLVLLYIFLFTPLGNRMMTPIVERSLSSALSTPVALREFSLRHNRFHLMIQDAFGNTLSTQGGFSLLTLRLYAHYRLECFHEKGLNPITEPFKTEGALSGGIAAFDIHGNATVFGGDILYQIELHRFHLAILELKLHNIAYEPLLHVLEYPSKTDTILSGNIALRGFDRRDVDGLIHVSTQTHRFTPTPIQEDSNESFDLKSLLADKFGHIKPFDVNITIDASLEHAGILEQFVGIPLGGSAEFSSTLSGDEKLLTLNAHTDVAESNTTLFVSIPNLEPTSVVFHVNHADLKEVFTLFALKAPVTGRADGAGEFTTKGAIVTLNVTKASTLPDVLRQEYNITQPLIHFNAAVRADVTPKGVHYRGSFKSDLNRMQIDTTTTHDQMLSGLLKTLR